MTDCSRHHIDMFKIVSNCQDGGCRGQLVRRRRRFIQGATQPAIHFGLMASGDTVMKSGEDRDSIAKRENILAFEMEGAGGGKRFLAV